MTIEDIKTMIDYKIVKYCIICKERYVVRKGDSRRIYCDVCTAKVAKQRAEQNAADEQ